MRAVRSVLALVVLSGIVGFTSPKTGCGTYAQTKYPIVLCHGALGFDSLLGVLDYWFGIAEDLAAGGARVFVTEVSSVNSSEVRGEQLITQIEQIVAITGKPKVNLIGHSQGGLDVRYVAAVRPDLVASVTTVGAPHAGSQVAEYLAANFVNGGFTEDVIAQFGDGLGTIIGLLSGSSNPQDAIAAIRGTTWSGLASFNSRYPAGLPTTACGSGDAVVNDIRYYSWTGTGVLTNSFDRSDIVLGIASLFMRDPSDGLVDHCSAHLGQVIRDNYLYNHLDEVNQIAGLVSPFEVNQIAVYRSQANRLKLAGL